MLISLKSLSQLNLIVYSYHSLSVLIFFVLKRSICFIAVLATYFGSMLLTIRASFYITEIQCSLYRFVRCIEEIIFSYSPFCCNKVVDSSDNPVIMMVPPLSIHLSTKEDKFASPVSSIIETNFIFKINTDGRR